MTRDEVMATLESLADPKVRAHNRKFGAGENQFGVKLGEIRALAKRIKVDHALALELWETGNLDARLLAVLLFDLKKLARADVDRLVRAANASQLADWLNAYVVKEHPEKEALRQVWMADGDPWAARAGWALTSGRIGKSPQGLDLSALLDRIEREMPTADPAAQWTINFCLAGIGIHFPEHRERAIAIGEALGLYRDYPVPKGCTSPFAPIWIREMVSRLG